MEQRSHQWPLDCNRAVTGRQRQVLVLSATRHLGVRACVRAPTVGSPAHTITDGAHSLSTRTDGSLSTRTDGVPRRTQNASWLQCLLCLRPSGGTSCGGGQGLGGPDLVWAQQMCGRAHLCPPLRTAPAGLISKQGSRDSPAFLDFSPASDAWLVQIHSRPVAVSSLCGLSPGLQQLFD